jgi:hypothetical protein
MTSPIATKQENISKLAEDLAQYLLDLANENNVQVLKAIGIPPYIYQMLVEQETLHRQIQDIEAILDRKEAEERVLYAAYLKAVNESGMIYKPEPSTMSP